MNKTKKKIFLALFVGLLFALSAYFNVYMLYGVNTDEILSVASGEKSFSQAPKIMFNTVEKYYKTFIKNKVSGSDYVRIDKFIDLYGMTQKAFNCDVVFAKDAKESVVKFKDGQLMTFDNPTVEYSVQAEKIKNFSNWIYELDTDFLFLQAPSKEVDATKAPAGVVVPTETENDKVAESFREEQVDFISLEDNPELPENKAEWYYRTDHHWTTRVGFASAQYIVKKINCFDEYSLNAEILNLDNFKTEVHESVFLGTKGRKVGSYFAGRDNLELFLPNFETSFVYEITHLSGHVEKREGSFEQTMVFRENLERDYHYTNPYCSYMGGDYPLAVIENLGASCEKSILVIKDSYANAVVPFLALTTRKVTIIDPRHFEDSIKDYIINNKPDMVLMLYHSGASVEKAFWEIK